MAVTRQNIMTGDDALNDYVEGVRALKAAPSGITTGQFGLSGEDRPINVYDSFVLWHIFAADEGIPPGTPPGLRNSAHKSPTFLPWHRYFLITLETEITKALDRPFALPYWDWAADADDGAPQFASIWTNEMLGGDGDPVTSGPFQEGLFSIFLETGPDDRPLAHDGRALRRRFDDSDLPALPTSSDVWDMISGTSTYDAFPYSVDTTDGFRGEAEGSVPADGNRRMHNLLHHWIGGDMIPTSSPNDPVFFLLHCNIDRIWERWMMQAQGRIYAPEQSAPDGLAGIRPLDELYGSPAGLGQPDTIGRMLDMTMFYDYDRLPQPQTATASRHNSTPS